MNRHALCLSVLGLVLGASRPSSAGATQPAASQPTSRPGAARGVYFNDFEKGAGPEWSERQVEKTPLGERGFLGQFGNQTVTLTLEGLPAHRYVRVAWELYLLRTWDGNMAGGDRWALGVVGGARLVHTTFHTYPFEAGSPSEGLYRQAYPDAYPFGDWPSRTGAAEQNTLGYEYQAAVDDAVYRLSVVVPHTGRELGLEFSAEGLQGLEDESWGLDNVRVEVLSEPPSGRLAEGALDEAWADLSGEEPVKAEAAVWRLAGADADVVGFLRRRLHAPVLDAAKVRALIQALDDKDYVVRENAQRALGGMGAEIVPELQAALAHDPPPEIAFRAGRLVEQLTNREMAASGKADAQTVVESRVLRLLEVLRTGDARALVQVLAARSFSAALRQDAAEALKRWE